MMVGTFLTNCWMALISFTVYFLCTFKNGIPSKVLLGSFITAIIAFVLTYPLRLLIGYIFYTPEDELFEQLENKTDTLEHDVFEALENENVNAENEKSDESPEDIANVVRTMINQDDTIATN